MTTLEVALKVWDRLSPNEHRRFLREVDVMRRATAGRLEGDTCVVELMWAGQAQGPLSPVAWVAMGLYGCSLGDRLRRRPPPTAEAAARICLDLLTGLGTLHEAGILHRDIKPANVLLREDGAVLSDFGLAARRPDDVTVLGAGTPGFIAPEHEGSDPAPPSTAADVYAAGRTIEAAFAQVIDMPAGVRRGVDVIIARATDVDPQARYKDAVVMRTALARALADNARPRDRLITSQDRLITRLRRRRSTHAQLRKRISVPVVAAGVAAIALGAAITWPLPGRSVPVATIRLASGGDVVGIRECFTGEITGVEGSAAVLGARSIDSLDAPWSVELVHPLPPVGARGQWQTQMFFGVGGQGVGQRFELRLASVPAEMVPERPTPAQLTALMSSATQLADEKYRRVAGPGTECER